MRHVELISRQLRDIFVDFQKIILQASKNSKSGFKKSFFQRPTRLGFWLVESFLRTLQVCYAYEKYSLKSKLSFGKTQSIMRHIEMISRQLRAIFVDFQKIMLREVQNSSSKYRFFNAFFKSFQLSNAVELSEMVQKCRENVHQMRQTQLYPAHFELESYDTYNLKTMVLYMSFRFRRRNSYTSE